MKIYLSLIALLATCMIQAQKPEPVVKRQGKSTEVTYFHENGQIAQVGHFLNGKLHGDWKMFDAAGNKLAVGQYTEGQKTGKWFFWSDKGLSEVDYQDNQVAQVVRWNNGEAVVVN